jgi:hypothetical protein
MSKCPSERIVQKGVSATKAVNAHDGVALNLLLTAAEEHFGRAACARLDRVHKPSYSIRPVAHATQIP